MTYMAQAVQFIPYLLIAPDDALIHALSQTLLWITLSLILVNSAVPLPSVWLGVATSNLILESVICGLTFAKSKDTNFRQLYVLGALQSLTCLALLLHTIVALLLVWPSHVDHHNDEIQSLLRSNTETSNHSSSSVRSYRGVSTSIEVVSEHYEADNVASESISDDEGDGDDDEELKAIQKKRLTDHGGWISYLKEFRIFLPFVLPKDDRRLQLCFAFSMVNILVIRLLNVLHPWQLGIVIDSLTIHKIVPWKQIIIWIGLQIAASQSCGVGAINEMLENRISAWSHQKLSIASFDHVMSLSMVFHDQKDSGEIIKAIQQAGALSSLLQVALVQILPGAMDIVVAMWYITYLFDIYALLIIVAVGISFIFVTYYITTSAVEARRQSSKTERDESKIVYESVSNWFTISYFNRKKYAMSRLSLATSNTAKAKLWSDDLYTYLYGAQELCEQLGFLAVAILAAYRIVQGDSTVGKFVTLENYWYTMTMPLYVLGHSYRQLNSDLVDAERLLQLFKQLPTVADRPGAKSIDFSSGEVSFDDVEFAYEGRELTLRGVNIKAEPGQMIALVGETGSGKSTIFKLLMRFHDVSAGNVSIDGVDIRDITIDSLRECFGFVPQDTVLFNMSILENVRYARLEATDEEIYAACRAASIHDKILSFPSGYASKVGERGVKLSGGERQRIAIARVFLKDARIVLLDEATSAMDSHTESNIQAALRRLVKGRTTFVIAHRLSTVIEADKILVVNNGQIIESGTHAELLLKKGKFLDLWNKQTSTTKSE